MPAESQTDMDLHHDANIFSLMPAESQTDMDFTKYLNLFTLYIKIDRPLF